MSKKNAVFSSATLLAVAVGLFLLLSGVQTLVDLDSPVAKAAQGLGKLFGADQTGAVLTIVFAVLKIASGVVLIAGPFGLLTSGLRVLAFWVIVGFWAVLTVWTSFFAVPLLKPTPMLWVQNLSLNVAVLAALWQLKPEKG